MGLCILGTGSDGGHCARQWWPLLSGDVGGRQVGELELKEIGKYKIEAEIGRGALGEVYKARDPENGRAVALKLITNGAAQKPELRERLSEESRAAAALRHPNIVALYEAGQEGQFPFVAMEYVEGESLEKMLARRETLPLTKKVGFLLQICRALDYAHQHGVVHGDLQPGNILVTGAGEVKVTEFGVSHVAHAAKMKSGTLIGTMSYLSPQQLRGEPADAQADVWAAGVLCYELLSGRQPFTGDNPAALVLNILSQEPEPLTALVSNCPAALDAIVRRMLRKETAERCATMAEALAELEQVREGMRQQEQPTLIPGTTFAAVTELHWPDENAEPAEAAAPAQTAAPAEAVAPTEIVEPATVVAAPAASVPSEAEAQEAAPPAEAAAPAEPAEPTVPVVPADAGDWATVIVPAESSESVEAVEPAVPAADGESAMVVEPAVPLASAEYEADAPVAAGHTPLFAPVPQAERVPPEPRFAPVAASSTGKRFVAVAAAGIVLAAAVGTSLYFVLSTRSGASRQAKAAQAAALQAPVTPPPNPLEAAQRQLIEQAKQLAARQDYPQALEKAQEALKVNGPLQPEAQSLRDQIVKSASDEAAQAALQAKDAQLWKQAVDAYQQGKLDQATTGFQQLAGLGGAPHQADAQDYLKHRIPQARRADLLFHRGQVLARQTDNERSLLQADRDLREVTQAGGAHAAEAAHLLAGVRARLAVLRHQRQFHALVSRFESPASQNPETLRRLQAQFRRLESVDGPIADQAREYAETRIPEEMNALRKQATPPAPSQVAARTPTPPVTAPASAAPTRRYLWVVSLDSIPPHAAWNGSLTAGQKVSQAYVEGGVKLKSHPLPLDFVREATEKNGQFRMLLSIDTEGHVSAAQLISGDASLGQALLQAVERDWQFAPPRVNNTPVSTSAQVGVYF
jgi:predicted Ser/Thr protein kinase